MGETEENPFFCYKMIRQTQLVALWTCLGIVWQLISPTLPDIKDSIGVNYEEISRTLFVQSGGFFVGTIVGGMLNERFYVWKDILMGIAVMLGAVGMSMVPFSSSLQWLGFALFLGGFSAGLVNSGGNTMVLHLWGDKAASPQHSLHFGFGVGSIISPQLARPFLSERTWVNVTDVPGYANISNQTTMIEITTKESNLVVPYLAGSAFIVLISFSFFLSHIIGAPKDFPKRTGSKTMKSLFNPASCGYGHSKYSCVILFLTMIYFTFTCGSEHSYGRFIFSFAIESDLKFTKDEAALLSSAFWAMFTLGRGCGTIVAKFMRVNTMVWIEFSFALLSIVIIAIWGHNTSMVLWIASCSYALMLAPIFPGGVSWANLQLEMNSMAVMVIMIGCSSGSMLYIYLSGVLFEYLGPRSMMYIQVVLVTALGLTFASMECIAMQFRKVRKVEKEEIHRSIPEENELCMEDVV